MTETLYDADFYAWTQEQAALLRTLPHSNALDIEHLAEEIEDMGRAELNKVSSLLRQIFLHLIKCAGEPAGDASGHWAGEILSFQFDLARAFAPSMRQRVDLDEIWRSATKAARRDMLGAKLPAQCPWTLEMLVDPDFDVDAAIGLLGSEGRPS